MTTSSVKAMLQTGSEIMFVLVFVFVAPACSHTWIGRGAEPPTIMVRNSSGADLAEVSLSEAAGGSASRYGSISPVPRGASQVFGRGTNPQQFPRTVNLEWIDSQGSSHSRELSLKKVLRAATGTKGEALIFDINSQGNVDVYLELTTSSAASDGK
jgi:hypothetical protein